MASFVLDDATRMDRPIQRGPAMHWQRKAMENSQNSSSLSRTNSSTDASNSSCSRTPKTPSSRRTPSVSPSRLSGNMERLSLVDKGKTPSKGSRSNSNPGTPSHVMDRFIPNRSAMDFDRAHYLLSGNGENFNPDNPTASPGTSEQQRRMATALNGGTKPETKILHFAAQAPPVYKGGFINDMMVLYSGKTSSVRKTSTSRHIPQSAERILDAPELLNDYYLNLLDWSVNNHMAVALGQSVYLWNASSGSIVELATLENAEEYISSVRWLPEGNILAVGTSSAAVQLWDIKTTRLVRVMTGHSSRVGALDWNNHILTSGSRSGAIHHSDVRVAQHLVATLNIHTQEVCGLRWSANGQQLASGGNDNMVYIWDNQMSSGGQVPLHSLVEHQAAVKALAWCPWQNSLLATGGGTLDRKVCFWNTLTGACVLTKETESQVCGILWNSEHHELCTGHGYSQNQLSIWKYPQMKKVTDLLGHQNRILHLSLSPDGTTVASAAADETLRLWKCWENVEHKKTKSSHKETTSVLHKCLR